MTTWVNPTTLVTEVRTMLVACQAFVTAVADAGNENNYVNYPTSDSDDTLPHAVIYPGQSRRVRVAEGMPGLPRGDFTIVLHLSSASYTIGQAESLAEDIVDQMCNQDAGLSILDGEHELSSEPANEDVAGDNDEITIDCVFTYGPED